MAEPSKPSPKPSSKPSSKSSAKPAGDSNGKPTGNSAGKPGRAAHPLAQRKTGPKPGPARRPLPAGEQFFTPGSTGLRQAVERRSAALLVFLFQLPRWIVPVVMVALLLVGFAVADWRGGLAVLPVLVFVVLLGYLSWPSLRLGGRLLRVALATFLLLVALTRFGVI